uniref:1-phosphatidylinositol 4-kinase n=1 Tax=Spongospora subterranea TaxID=70186 RepID=A0A0H5RQZ2_9EUKA|eukprot:CRZ11139.1 hypothetical protein [Spongospora subterranea]
MDPIEPLILRQASYNGSSLLEKFKNDGVDAWMIIQHLLSTSHGGVRDYLINQMYDLQSDQFDFFLPQLCCFLVAWPEEDRQSLEQFMLIKCSKSLHCAMKMFWLLHAMAPYCTAIEQRSRCTTLATTCETVVINSCQPKFLGKGPKSANDVAPALSPSISIRLDKLLARNVSLLNRLAALDMRLNNACSGHSRSDDDGRSAILSGLLLKRSHSQDSFMTSEGHSAQVHSPSAHDELRSSKRSGKFWENGIPHSPNMYQHRHSHVGLSSSTSATIRDFDVFLAKQQMSEFFTAELHLIAALEEISSDLLRYEGSHRKLQLQRLLTVLNERVCRGLYLPTGQARDRHYVILRILSHEVSPLSSREKVPFLMPIEIMYTRRNCSGEVHNDYFVDHESCRRHLLHLMEQHETRSVPSSPLSSLSSKASNIGYPFGELLADRKARIRASSPFGRLQDWDVLLMIFKSGDDCRQEHLAMQMITYIDELFKAALLPLRLRPLDILVCSPTSGLIECVPDSKSIDALKKSIPGFQSLLWFFENHFGPRGSPEFAAAQKNFVESMAAYSLVSYLLQIKDRHNGNILLTNEGLIVHIDFGFMLSNSPGGNINFERAPFKLTAEFVEVMEGEDSEAFHYFRLLMIRGFLELRNHCDRLCALAEILFMGPPHDCFYGGRQALVDLRERFHATDSEQIVVEFVYSLVSQSINNWRSVQYDTYQRITNGIL